MAFGTYFIKLNPKTQAQNPVMLLVYISAILTTILWIIALCGLKDASAGYTLAIAIILWFTVLFANFAEAIAEGRGKAQADSLRAAKKDVEAHKIPSADQKDAITVVSSATLKKGDIVIVRQQNYAETGDIVIVLINGDSATCKRLVKYQEGITLISFNPAYKPMKYSNKEILEKPINIIGKVVENRQKY